MILGIDTSLGTAVASIERDGVIVAEADRANPLGHAEAIGILLERVLGATGAVSPASAHHLRERTSNPVQTDVRSPRSYDLGERGGGGGGGGGVAAVAAGMGPGPFTGLRIGIAAARAFALGRGIPVVPVVSHDAIALELMLADALRGADDAGRFAVVTDARRREYAYSVYDGIDDDGLPVRVFGPALAHRDAIDDVLAGHDAARRDAHRVSAAMVALAASRAIAAGREIGPRDALYLRSPDVVPPARPKKVAS